MYEAICLSGGGCKAVSLLGLLYEWNSKDPLKNVKYWSTCSVGSFIAVLILCGLNPLQILRHYPKIDNMPSTFDLLSSLVKKAGVMRIQKYSKKFCRVVEKFVGCENPTLQQFYEKTGATIFIEAVNYTTSEVVYFNHVDHPDIHLFSAVWASAAIPGVFIPIKIKGESYVDGGLYNPLPLEPIMDKETIAFDFLSKKDMFSILKLTSTIVKKQNIKQHKKLHVIECKCNFTLLDFGKTYTQLLDEFAFGRQQYVTLTT